MKRFIPSKPVLIASGVALAVAAWMLTGLGRTSTSGSEAARAPDAQASPTRVSVQKSRARNMTREIVVSARTEPNRVVELRAETDGRVVRLGAERGSTVSAGDHIVSLDLRDRETRLEEGRAVLKQMELQLEAARRLQSQQFISEVQIAEAFARVATARTALEEIELEIANTTLDAPFDAVLQDRTVELGDYVNSGDSVAQLVDTDPLLVVGEVSEREVGALEVGSTGRALLVTGATVEGRIRYVSPRADENTRTFRIELAVANPERLFRAGMTAELRLAADEITAHLLSPALLTLDDAGVVGVKAVDDHDRVQFYPIEIVDSSNAGISVEGLPEEVRVITVGQGFVSVGERVVPVLAPPAEAGLTDASEAPQTPASNPSANL
jgi:multidrug efflux system membrane fusion protein